MEYARLALQSELLRPVTLRLFSDAGIAPGMRVLDLGSGAGDVCLMLAEMVGPSGEVVGLDLDRDAIATAARRAAQAGHGNITLVHSDFAHYAPESPFDAIVGRLVLMYQADPAALLRCLIPHLRPGGAVAFMEPWFMPAAGPDSTVKRMAESILEVFRRSGAHLDLGPRLHNVFTGAGLPLPRMRFEAVMDGSPDSPIAHYVAATFASTLPKAIEYGIPGVAEIDIATAPGRILAEVSAVGYAMLTLPMVCAWCRTPAAL
jgi:SAM-dependent methyltransferase